MNAQRKQYCWLLGGQQPVSAAASISYCSPLQLYLRAAGAFAGLCGCHVEGGGEGADESLPEGFRLGVAIGWDKIYDQDHDQRPDNQD